jgi:Ser/Thr protein kinase RdoA (MazF antagonist)
MSAVGRAFGLGSPTGPASVAARGEQGRIWRLATDGGTWAVKELFFSDWPNVAADATADLGFQELALAAGVPMPRPIRTLSGEALLDLGEPGRPAFVRVYTWAELAGRDVVPALPDVAAILGRLHAVAPRDDRPMIAWTTTPPPAGLWSERHAAARAAGAGWADSLATIAPILVDTVAATGPVDATGTVTCHLDFNPENVLVDLGGRPIVVDWENAGPAPAEQELASGVAEFVRDPAMTAPFLEAYELAGGTARLRGRSSFAMTAIVQANLIEAYTRWALDETADPERRARAAHWIADIAANAFTVEAFDAWLAAAATRR